MQSLDRLATSHKSQQELFNFIQEAACIGTWEYDVTTSKLEWSDQTRKIHEVGEDFVPNVEDGINFYRNGYSKNKIIEVFTKCIEEHKSYDVELEIKTGKGKYKWVRAIGKATVVNDKCVKVTGLFQDIDKKTKDALKLAEKEEQLRMTFERSIVGMATLSLDGRWLTVNDSLCNILGYSKKELLKLNYIDLKHPDDIKSGNVALFDMVSGKIDHFQTEKRFVNKSGKLIYCFAASSVIKDEQGKPLHFLMQISNITPLFNQKKKIEKLLGQSEHQNERLLNFAHIVSHNLRSHSSNLGMLIDIAKEDTPQIFDNEILPMVEHAVRQLGETVENLNEVATISAKKNHDLQPVNLDKTLNKVFLTLAAQIKETNTVICKDVDSQTNVKAIPAYLDSILLNLITNAIKYKKPDLPAKISIKTSTLNKKVIVDVIDFGMGIDLNTHGKKLFGMYKTFHRHKDARGLGLFITKNQVEALGGTIEVESEVDKGSTFRISLQSA